jgi:hypothetical protein
VESSPVGYLFPHEISFLSPWARLIREEKKGVKEKIYNERKALIELDQLSGELEDCVLDYQLRFKNIHILHQELNRCRLKGDEFLIQYRTSLHKISISKIGHILIYKFDPDHPEEVSFENLLEMKQKHILVSPKDVITLSKVPNSYKGEGYEEMVLETRNRKEIRFGARERSEMIEVIGGNISRWNKNKVQLITTLKKFWKLKLEKYDKENIDHEFMLMDLWNSASSDKKLENRISDQWERIGFQGKDPSTDFRGMGLLGLKNCTYFAKRYTSFIKSVIADGRDYPFCVAGINITGFLVELLNLQQVVELGMSDSKWETPLFVYLCVEQMDHENPFEELYCKVVLMLDLMFMEEKAGYMDFPRIFDKLKEKVKSTIEIF